MKVTDIGFEQFEEDFYAQNTVSALFLGVLIENSFLLQLPIKKSSDHTLGMIRVP